MTPKQQYIFEKLFNGGDIVYNGRGVYTVRGEAKEILMRFDVITYRCIREHLRKRSVNGFSVWTVNVSSILKLHGKSWLKRAYIIQRNFKRDYYAKQKARTN